VETLNHLQRLTGYGVNYRSFTEQYLDSTGMFKEAVIGILAAVAKQERVRLSERTIAGLQRAKAQGRVGGRPRTEHDPRKMAKLAALRQTGNPIRRIANELDLSATTVARLLRQPEDWQAGSGLPRCVVLSLQDESLKSRASVINDSSGIALQVLHPETGKARTDENIGWCLLCDCCIRTAQDLIGNSNTHNCPRVAGPR
jgi:hypothetical protein